MYVRCHTVERELWQEEKKASVLRSAIIAKATALVSRVRFCMRWFSLFLLPLAVVVRPASCHSSRLTASYTHESVRRQACLRPHTTGSVTTSPVHKNEWHTMAHRVEMTALFISSSSPSRSSLKAPARHMRWCYTPVAILLISLFSLPACLPCRCVVEGGKGSRRSLAFDVASTSICHMSALPSCLPPVLYSALLPTTTHRTQRSMGRAQGTVGMGRGGLSKCKQTKRQTWCGQGCPKCVKAMWEVVVCVW